MTGSWKYWKYEIRIGGTWYPHGAAYLTKSEAEARAARECEIIPWLECTDVRVVEYTPEVIS